MVGSLTACSLTDVPAFNADDVGENTLYKMTQAAQYLMLSYSEHFLESSYRLHSMANIHVVGRMETALAVGLYFTACKRLFQSWPTRWSCDRKSQAGEAALRFCHCSQLSGRQDDASRLPTY